MVSEHAGSCHCGGVRFTVGHDPDELTTCDCSLCVKRNAVMAKVPEAALRIDAGEDLLTLYEWNTRRAKHYFCRRCGIYVFHRKRAAPDHFGINIFCLHEFDIASLPVRRTDGVGMSVVTNGSHEDWPGPNQAPSDLLFELTGLLQILPAAWAAALIHAGVRTVKG